ncbi:MAG: hypothetical protein V7746_00690 [Halioglobus sp.]
MKTLKKIPLRLLAVVVLALVVQVALAGTAEVTSGSQSMQIQYEGGMLRMDVGQGEGAYMLLRDGHVYMVSIANGQPMVIDASQSMSMMGNMAGSSAPAAAAGKVLALDATGKMETHAGIKGEVYNLKFIDIDGKEMQTELVLSDDARAKGFSNAMSAMAVTMSSVAGQDYSAAANDIAARLKSLDMGVLRYGQDMSVTALNGDTVAASRFELPAKPMDLSGLRGLMGQ